MVRWELVGIQDECERIIPKRTRKACNYEHDATGTKKRLKQVVTLAAITCSECVIGSWRNTGHKKIEINCDMDAVDGKETQYGQCKTHSNECKTGRKPTPEKGASYQTSYTIEPEIKGDSLSCPLNTRGRFSLGLKPTDAVV